MGTGGGQVPFPADGRATESAGAWGVPGCNARLWRQLNRGLEVGRPEAPSQLAGARVGRNRGAVERGERHDAAHRVREEQTPPLERVPWVAAFLDLLCQLDDAGPTYPWQDAEIEPRGPQVARLPPEHAPHRALGHQAVV